MTHFLEVVKANITLPRLVAAWMFLTACATWINARLPKDEAGDVVPPKSWKSFLWRSFIDLAAATPQPGKAGLFGMLPVNLPGFPSHTPPVPAAVQQ